MSWEPLVVPTYEGDINEHLAPPDGFCDRDLRSEPMGDAHLYRCDDEGAPLVISFGGSGYNEQGEAMFAGEKFLSRYAINRFHLRDAFNVWYFNGVRGHSTDIAMTTVYLSTLLQFLGPREVICTGTSAGGFAAILFGVLLKVDRVIAINPQTLLQNNVECFAHGNLYKLKWTNPNDAVYYDLFQLPPSSTRIDIAYGRDDLVDRFHSGRMGARPDVTLYPAKGDHATTPRALRDNHALAGLFSFEESP